MQSLPLSCPHRLLVLIRFWIVPMSKVARIMADSIKARLDRGDVLNSMAIGTLPSPKLVEAVGAIGGVDCLWFDQEHSTITDSQLELLLVACRAAGFDAFARVPPTNYVAVMRPLEAGCSGVMVAQIRTLEEVKRVVSWVKFPPRGIRGFYGSKADARYATVPFAEYAAAADRNTWLAIQIETAEAVEIVDDIAHCDGVDVLFVGPSDLSLALGVPGDMLHRKCVDALQRVSAAAKKSGKSWGIVASSPEHLAKCKELGCQLLSVYSDMGVVHAGMRAIRAAMGGSL